MKNNYGENNNKLHTAYDNAGRTLQTDCPSLILPVINILFDKDYTGDEEVLVYANELFPEGIVPQGEKLISDGKRFAKLNFGHSPCFAKRHALQEI